MLTSIAFLNHCSSAGSTDSKSNEEDSGSTPQYTPPPVPTRIGAIGAISAFHSGVSQDSNETASNSSNHSVNRADSSK